jgi:hypothetical protein
MGRCGAGAAVGVAEGREGSQARASGLVAGHAQSRACGADIKTEAASMTLQKYPGGGK